MDLSIIIVSYNVRDKLRENLKALYQSQGNFSFETFVVDNASVDGSVDMVRQEFLEIKLIANQENVGFARANNQVIRESHGDFILLLNPDMRVFPDTLINMLNWMRNNPQASVAGCHLVDKQGNTIMQVRRFPKVWDQLAIILKLPHILPNILKSYIRADFNYNQAAKVDSIRGGFFMLRRETIAKVGVLDERFFLWFEEVDYCQRVYQSNGEVWYTPAGKCLDYIGQSFKQLPRGQMQRYFRDSMLKYFKKWHPDWQYLLLKLVWPIGLILTLSGEKIKINSQAKT